MHSPHGPHRHPTALAAALAAALLCLAAVEGSPAAAPGAQAAKEKLAAVRARIAELASRRAAELKQRDAEAARLRQAELDVTVKRRALDNLQTAAAAASERRDALRAEERRTESALAARRAALAGQIRSTAMMGRQQQIKLLLNQTDARRLGRMLAYEGYFSRARAAEIREILAALDRIKVLFQEIEQQSRTLDALAEDTRRELGALLQARVERASALAAIAQRVKTADQSLAALRREEQAVESLLADLARVLQDFPTDAAQSFGALRGKLPWPVSGRLAARYHDLRAASPQGGLRWNGVLIDAERGAKVRAPFFGRVVYADWLQGLGLLMIISHSGGYMSLYGHAEVLYKAVGDSVAPGDVIAAMSDSPGPAAQLYFEIRQGRKPLDPRQWLK